MDHLLNRAGIYLPLLALIIIMGTKFDYAESTDAIVSEESFQNGEFHKKMPNETDAWNAYIETFVSRGKKDQEKCNETNHEIMLRKREKHVLVINKQQRFEPGVFSSIFQTLNESLNETLVYPGYCSFNPFWTKNDTDLYCGEDGFCQLAVNSNRPQPPSQPKSVKEGEMPVSKSPIDNKTTEKSGGSEPTPNIVNRTVITLTAPHNTSDKVLTGQEYHTVLENSNNTRLTNVTASPNSTAIMSAIPALNLNLLFLLHFYVLN